MRVPRDVLDALLSSSYLKSAIRGSVITFDKVWEADGPAPVSGTVLTVLNKDPNLPLNVGTEFTLSDTGLMEFYALYEPMIIADAPNDLRIIETQRQTFLEAGIACAVFFPLIAGGEKYGMLCFYFAQARAMNIEDVRYLRGLVDQAATSIYNFRLLEAEAKARREAEKANNLKLKFLAMISHELRTPLTSIKGFATTLLAKDIQWQPEDQRDFLETIDIEADKLTDLIEQLLDLSRLEAGTMRITRQRVSWEDILSTAAAQLQVLTVNHKLVVANEANLPMLKVDVIRIPQVITNLVSNAVKYSPAHSVITISASRVASEQFIKVSIRDQGMGIPFEERNHVFEAFRQLERDKEATKGAGLGLAICRGLLEAHGARIWIDDHDGPGTTISFTLPID
jgi:two-component system sensor histidine kinase KdpD